MNCSACGTHLVQQSKFCSGCGATLIARAVPSPKRISPAIVLVLTAGFFSLIALFCVFSPSDSTTHHSAAVHSTSSSLPPYLAGGGLGAPAAPAAYTRPELASILALYHGKLDGASLFQRHCGPARSSYRAATGLWSGATVLIYDSDQAGHNPSGHQADVLVFIAPISAIPHWLGSIYSEDDDGKYAMKAYLYMPGQVSDDEYGHVNGRTVLDSGRLVALLGCRP